MPRKTARRTNLCCYQIPSTPLILRELALFIVHTKSMNNIIITVVLQNCFMGKTCTFVVKTKCFCIRNSVAVHTDNAEPDNKLSRF